MLVQVGLESKGLVAPFAFEVFESRVSLHVRPQVGAVGKRLSAVGTAVGLVSRVGSHVTLQEPRSRKGLSTDVAFVTEVVGEDVHGERWH